MLNAIAKKQMAAFGRKWNYDTSYMSDIIDQAGAAAVMPLTALQKLHYRKDVPLDVYHAAAITSARAADCGPCLQLGVSMAEAAGVPRAVLRALLEGDETALSTEVGLGIELARATLARDGTGDEVRRQIVQRWGMRALVSLAYAIVAAQSFPTFKYAMGYGKSCARVNVGGQVVAIRRSESPAA